MVAGLEGARNYDSPKHITSYSQGSISSLLHLGEIIHLTDVLLFEIHHHLLQLRTD